MLRRFRNIVGSIGGALLLSVLVPAAANAATLQGSVLDFQTGGVQINADAGGGLNLVGPVITRISNAASVGGDFQFKNAFNNAQYCGSHIYDNQGLHVQACNGNGALFLDNATTVAGNLSITSGGLTVQGRFYKRYHGFW